MRTAAAVSAIIADSAPPASRRGEEIVVAHIS
eukprot:SAG31_NODE_33193_length_346_cov_3.449393_1_plen_31_part_10